MAPRKHTTLTSEDEKEYTVERIAKAKVFRAGRGKRVRKVFKYYVQWKGYGRKYDTWEPAENFTDDTILQTFWDKVDRDVERAGDFKLHEEFFPAEPSAPESDSNQDKVGPPSKRKRASSSAGPKKRSKATSKANKSDVSGGGEPGTLALAGYAGHFHLFGMDSAPLVSQYLSNGKKASPNYAAVHQAITGLKGKDEVAGHCFLDERADSNDHYVRFSSLSEKANLSQVVDCDAMKFERSEKDLFPNANKVPTGPGISVTAQNDTGTGRFKLARVWSEGEDGDLDELFEGVFILGDEKFGFWAIRSEGEEGEED